MWVAGAPRDGRARPPPARAPPGSLGPGRTAGAASSPLRKPCRCEAVPRVRRSKGQRARGWGHAGRPRPALPRGPPGSRRSIMLPHDVDCLSLGGGGRGRKRPPTRCSTAMTVMRGGGGGGNGGPAGRRGGGVSLPEAALLPVPRCGARLGVSRGRTYRWAGHARPWAIPPPLSPYLRCCVMAWPAGARGSRAAVQSGRWAQQRGASAVGHQNDHYDALWWWLHCARTGSVRHISPSPSPPISPLSPPHFSLPPPRGPRCDGRRSRTGRCRYETRRRPGDAA